MKKLSILILLTLFTLNNGNLWAEGDKAPAAEEKVSLLANPSEAKDAGIYSCPMHPEVRQDKEGKCPMCGMDLEKVKDPADSEKKEDATHDGHEHDSSEQGVN